MLGGVLLGVCVAELALTGRQVGCRRGGWRLTAGRSSVRLAVELAIRVGDRDAADAPNAIFLDFWPLTAGRMCGRPLS